MFSKENIISFFLALSGGFLLLVYYYSLKVTGLAGLIVALAVAPLIIIAGFIFPILFLGYLIWWIFNGRKNGLSFSKKVFLSFFLPILVFIIMFLIYINKI